MLRNLVPARILVPTFYDWIRNYKKKAYEKVANTSERKRVKESLYKPVEDYIFLRQQLYKRVKYLLLKGC